MKNREQWVDYAKAIGIILVVYGHVARGLYNGGIDLPIIYYKFFDSVVYSFHMPLFFFLSGLFFYESFYKRGASKLILSKIDTIFYPYIIWSLFQGGIAILLSNYTNNNVSLVEVTSLLWAPRDQFWFLYALFFIFVLSSVIYSLISIRFILPIFFCSIVLYVYPTVLPQGIIFGFISNNFVFFLLGVVFTMYLRPVFFSSKLALIGLTFLFVMAQWYFHCYLSYSYTDRGVESLVLACISIAFVISISLYLSQMNLKLFTFIGSSSMGIYLMHILAGSGSRIILSKVFGVESVVIHLILGCLIGIMAPLIILFLIKKLNIKYLLSAPISNFIINSYKKLNVWSTTPD